jgi:alkylation response protein AidB-like acyl-CoA dehydrogenase
MRVAADAMAIMGRYGYSQESAAQRLARDAKILQIYEGTNQIQRIVIARQLLSEAERGAVAKAGE